MFRICILCMLVVLSLPAIAQAKILYVPLDNRPVCFEYVLDSLKKAKINVVAPPKEFVSDSKKDADVDKIFTWLERELPTSDAIVLSTDTLLYGGLVGSRTHHLSEKVLNSRMERLLKLASKGVRVYAYSTIMRTPRASGGRTEPPYYAEYGSKIFRYTQLQDKMEIEKLNKVEEQELATLVEQIPQEALADWQERRDKNFKINQALLLATQKGKFKYFVLGKDDTALYSASHREARLLSQISSALPDYKYQNFVGADQLGLILALKAINDLTHQMPFVYVQYNTGVGSDTIPTYEDMPIGQTVKGHIWASGGFMTKSKDRADLLLYMNTPIDGVTLESGNMLNSAEIDKDDSVTFIGKIKQDLDKGKKVAIADIAYGNGSDNALVTNLFKEDVAWRISSYAGWNTASNSLGYALGQGMLEQYTKKSDKVKLLSVRYSDEWGYQANVRTKVIISMVYPRGYNAQTLGDNTEVVQEAVSDELKEFMKPVLPQTVWQGLNITLPWQRTFEVFVKVI